MKLKQFYKTLNQDIHFNELSVENMDILEGSKAYKRWLTNNKTMKIKDIKTESQFYAIADIWYQRTINLIRIVRDESESKERRIKAYCLWRIMLQRMDAIVKCAIQLSTMYKIPSFHKGSACISEGGNEMIVNKGDKITPLRSDFLKLKK